nr:MAG TPA: Protein of unknown function (DUF551) [Caudoviricetes sp.]
MNVLEKIFEEIKELKRKQNNQNQDYRTGYFSALSTVEGIICSRMDEVRDMHVKRLIDANVLDNEVANFFLTITGNPKQTTVVRECKESFRRMIDEQPTVYANDGWIPVEKKLPEDDRYILLSFENFSIPLVGRYEENEKGGAFYLGDCDEEDTCISNDLYVNAWTYLPERYKGDSNA